MKVNGAPMFKNMPVKGKCEHDLVDYYRFEDGRWKKVYVCETCKVSFLPEDIMVRVY